MPAAWPIAVPQRFDPAAYRETGPRGAFIETPFTAGRPARRRGTLADYRVVELQLNAITVAEKAAFEAWFETTLSGGAESFDMTHPVTGELRTWCFLNPDAPFTIRAMRPGDPRLIVTMTLGLQPVIA